jgi:hypothetical protein
VERRRVQGSGFRKEEGEEGFRVQNYDVESFLNPEP